MATRADVTSGLLYHRQRTAGLCAHGACPTEAMSDHSLCDKHRASEQLRSKERHRQEKESVFAAYGGAVCACCGETEISFLTLDHIADNGAEDRRQRGLCKNTQSRGGGHPFYGQLRREGYPPGLQVLCWNCQWGKRLCNTCPHKRK
jgi:hypothetical protein